MSLVQLSKGVELRCTRRLLALTGLFYQTYSKEVLDLRHVFKSKKVFVFGAMEDITNDEYLARS